MNVSLTGHFLLGEVRRNLGLDRRIIKSSLSRQIFLLWRFFKMLKPYIDLGSFHRGSIDGVIIVKHPAELCSEKFSS